MFFRRAGSRPGSFFFLARISRPGRELSLADSLPTGVGKGLFANGENQKGRIVGPMAAAEFGNRTDYFLLYGLRGQRAVPFKQRQQPRLSKFLAIGVRGFRHAVREKDHTIAGRKPHASELIALLSENAENSAAVPQPL